MEEQNAFEHQVANGLGVMGGPGRRIDAMAMVRTASTQSPKWRFQSMFNATKFVVAGAIVALFGGFLLSGVLTTQPVEEPVPVVGASASASTEVVASVDPDPITEGEDDQPADAETTELLPGVDLEVEELRPGVFRVLSDGIRDLSKAKNVRAVTVGPDGDVWVLRGQEDSPRLLQLGGRGVTPGGRLPGTPTFVDGRYVRDGLPVCSALEVTVGDECLGTGDGELYRRSVTDETLPTIPASIPGVFVVRSAEAGLEPDQFIGSSLGVSSDGTAWAAVIGPSGTFDGLVSYDGETWTQVPYPTAGDAAQAFVLEVAVGPDGTVWVITSDERDITVRSWDGARWASYGPLDRRPVWAGTHFRPDGTIWFGAAVLDGESLVALGLPRSIGPLAFGPDGNAWAIDGAPGGRAGNLYVIIPEAVVATEVATTATE